MRHTGPVTQHEHPIPPGQRLVSTTDLKGRITYCNPAFVEASGYSREELLGQPHNLIRHPDMPEEAFRDLWATVSAGRPWTALVKNRRKDGDHYWVRANVTPLLEDGRPVGYMSVRAPADRGGIAEAEALYARMREADRTGTAGPRLAHGRVVSPGWRGHAQTALRHAKEHAVALPSALLALSAYALGAAFPSATTGGVAAAALGLLAGVMAGRWVRRPLLGMLGAARRMAAGDLRQHIAVDACGNFGELQAALAQLNVNLQSIVGDARGEMMGMQRAIGEISQGNVDMSTRTESQAGSLQETAASMEQITSTVRLSADSAREAATLAEATCEVTDTSLQAVQRVSSTMQGISESSRRIADISGLIDGIAFQTNLLALNAAVEAARVGEQGRGFGVVASEVRSLAQRTAEAAREIRGLVDTAQGRISAGVEEARTAAHTLRDTAQSVARVTRLVQEIRHASGEQLQGISQINEAISHLDGITQHNAAMVEQLSASAVALRERAVIVTESVQVFHTGEGDRPAPDAVALRRRAKVG
jgi:aerotaxis receptor